MIELAESVIIRMKSQKLLCTCTCCKNVSCHLFVFVTTSKTSRSAHTPLDNRRDRDSTAQASGQIIQKSTPNARMVLNTNETIG